jgi:hypothetical protein
MAHEMNQTKQYLRGKENIYIQGVTIGRSEARKEGVIYIQVKESEEALQGKK